MIFFFYIPLFIALSVIVVIFIKAFYAHVGVMEAGSTEVLNSFLPVPPWFALTLASHRSPFCLSLLSASTPPSWFSPLSPSLFPTSSHLQYLILQSLRETRSNITDKQPSLESHFLPVIQSDDRKIAFFVFNVLCIHLKLYRGAWDPRWVSFRPVAVASVTEKALFLFSPVTALQLWSGLLQSAQRRSLCRSDKVE